MFDPADADTSQPFAYQYAQAIEDENSEAEKQQGAVTFIVPPGSKSFVFRYVRNDHLVITSTDVIPGRLNVSNGEKNN